MCLELLVVPASVGQLGAKRLRAISGLFVRKIHHEATEAFHLALEPGCSCTLLADDAAWDAPTWRLRPEVLEGLAKLVNSVAAEAGGLRLRALWIGEDPVTEERVPLKLLLRDIRDNTVKNKHVYLVGKP